MDLIASEHVELDRESCARSAFALNEAMTQAPVRRALTKEGLTGTRRKDFSLSLVGINHVYAFMHNMQG